MQPFDEEGSEADMPDLGALAGFPSIHKVEVPLSMRLATGANAHQQAALYGDFAAACELIRGAALSYPALVNASAGMYLMGEFEKPAVAIIRYGSPLAVASAMSLEEAVEELGSLFSKNVPGSTVIFNRTVDGVLADQLASLLPELILAPTYTVEAKERLTGRTLLAPRPTLRADTLMECRSVSFGLLLQDRERPGINPGLWQGAENLGELWPAALFAWRVAKHVRSPGAVFVKGERTVVIAAGSYAAAHLPVLAHEIGGELDVLRGCVIALDEALESEGVLEAFARTRPMVVLHPGNADEVLEEILVQRAKALDVLLISTGRAYRRLC